MLTFLQHAPFAPALGGLAGFLSRGMGGSSEVGEDLASRLSTEQSRVISELEHHRAEATRLKQELESVWDNEHEAGYELTAVFIHRGSSPSFGHSDHQRRDEHVPYSQLPSRNTLFHQCVFAFYIHLRNQSVLV